MSAQARAYGCVYLQGEEKRMDFSNSRQSYIYSWMILFGKKYNLLTFGFMSERVCLYNSRMVLEKASQFVLSTVPDNSPLKPAFFTAVSQGIITARKPESWETSHFHAQIMIFLPFEKALGLHSCSYSRTWQGVWLVPPHVMETLQLDSVEGSSPHHGSEWARGLAQITTVGIPALSFRPPAVKTC